ncbi:MAG: hypothetical protein ACK5OS_02460 [Chryseotalea sp.]|jgi:hypothetical protein
MNTTSGSIALDDLIGQAIQQYVAEKNEITVLASQELGAMHPELVAGLRQKLHELRQQHQETTIALRNLKIQKKQELVNKLSAINLEIENSVSGLNDTELVALSQEIERKISLVEQEIQTSYLV